jgi:hypothetical protein
MMHTFGHFRPSVTHWIRNDLVTDQSKFAAACEAIYPIDGDGSRTVEVCFDAQSVLVTSKSLVFRGSP